MNMLDEHFQKTLGKSWKKGKTHFLSNPSRKTENIDFSKKVPLAKVDIDPQPKIGKFEFSRQNY